MLIIFLNQRVVHKEFMKKECI